MVAKASGFKRLVIVRASVEVAGGIRPSLKSLEVGDFGISRDVQDTFRYGLRAMSVMELSMRAVDKPLSYR